MFVARIPVSTIPEDVQPSAHAYQRAATEESTSQQSTLLRYHDAIIFFWQSRNENKSKSECSCEPSVRELRAQREQRIMYDRIPAQFVESVPGLENRKNREDDWDKMRRSLGLGIGSRKQGNKEQVVEMTKRWSRITNRRYLRRHGCPCKRPRIWGNRSLLPWVWWLPCRSPSRFIWAADCQSVRSRVWSELLQSAGDCQSERSRVNVRTPQVHESWQIRGRSSDNLDQWRQNHSDVQEEQTGYALSDTCPITEGNKHVVSVGRWYIAVAQTPPCTKAQWLIPSTLLTLERKCWAECK